MISPLSSFFLKKNPHIRVFITFLIAFSACASLNGVRFAAVFSKHTTAICSRFRAKPFRFNSFFFSEGEGRANSLLCNDLQLPFFLCGAGLAKRAVGGTLRRLDTPGRKSARKRRNPLRNEDLRSVVISERNVQGKHHFCPPESCVTGLRAAIRRPTPVGFAVHRSRVGQAARRAAHSS